MPFVASLTILSALLVPQDSAGTSKELQPATPTGLIVHAGKVNGPGTFMPWKSMETINNAILKLRKANGGRILWMPGTYEIPQPIEIWDGKDIQIEGMPGSILTFPPAPKSNATLAMDLVEGSNTILVENPELLHLNWRYQLYSSDGTGDRLLEFRVTGIEGNTIKIHPTIRFMRHVESVSKGCILIEHANFFELNRSHNITVRGLTMDGGSRGSVAGHTTYCGIIAAGLAQKSKRPLSQGLTIQDCTFRDLKGRGVAIYKTAGVMIKNCHFQGIAAQALEIDHYSTGVVTTNLIEDSMAGVTLNDAFDTEVTFNTIRNCSQSISLYKHFNDNWVNTGHLISSNHIAPKQGRPGILFHQPMTSNRIEGNYFLDCPKELWVQGAKGNLVGDNLAISSK